MSETTKSQLYKPDIVEGIATFARAEGVELTKKQADTAINGFIETVQQGLATGARINLIGFGSFEVRHRPERASWDMQRGEMVTLAARNYVYFKTGSTTGDVIEGVQFVPVEKNKKTKWVTKTSEGDAE